MILVRRTPCAWHKRARGWVGEGGGSTARSTWRNPLTCRPSSAKVWISMRVWHLQRSQRIWHADQQRGAIVLGEQGPPPTVGAVASSPANACSIRPANDPRICGTGCDP